MIESILKERWKLKTVLMKIMTISPGYSHSVSSIFVKSLQQEEDDWTDFVTPSFSLFAVSEALEPESLSKKLTNIFALTFTPTSNLQSAAGMLL